MASYPKSVQKSHCGDRTERTTGEAVKANPTNQCPVWFVKDQTDPSGWGSHDQPRNTTGQSANLLHFSEKQVSSMYLESENVTLLLGICLREIFRDMQNIFTHKDFIMALLRLATEISRSMGMFTCIMEHYANVQVLLSKTI